MPIADKRYLVTGGTGSFGNFIVHRLLDAGAREVRVLSRDEKKQYDMRVFYGERPGAHDDHRRRPRPPRGDGGDGRRRRRLQAAALKQVPTCERFPMEAVRTNVLGAQNIVEAGARARVESVVGHQHGQGRQAGQRRWA